MLMIESSANIIDKKYNKINSGYIGVTVPLISVKQCHFERSYNYIKN